MPIPHTIDKAAYESLGPDRKPLYLERDGKYVIDIDNSPALTALETERQARKTLEAKLAGYGELSPEEVKALRDSKTKAEREKDLAAGNFEKILAEERERHGKDLTLKEQAEARLRATLKAALIDAEATRAIVEHGGNPALLLPIIQARAKLETVGEREVAVITGEKGGPLLKAGAQKADEYMGISEFVATMKADKTYGGAFAAAVGSGSDTRPRPPGSGSRRIYTGKIADAIRRGETVLTKDTV